MSVIASPLPAAVAATRAESVPWYVWCAVLATTSSMVGIHWDISWHRSIGRDTFWTPAHVAIYMCGVLAGVSCGYLILATTFGRAAEALRAASVRIWGFRGPIGAFVAAWGGIAMLTSAPFDDWWHNAYGLDVRIISPPHMVLAVGMFSVQLGALLLVLGWRNRSEGAARVTLNRLYFYVAGLTIANMMTLLMEFNFRTMMHSGMFYRTIAMAIPFYLVALGAASGEKWAATRIAAIYMIFWQGMNWILVQFPAEPKLGPVFNPVTTFVPSYFPHLLVIPALAVDWVLARWPHWSVWRRGALAGLAFETVLLAVQWPMGNFLQSPLARNWFFLSHYWGYNTPSTSNAAQYRFAQFERTSEQFWINMGVAFAAAIVLSALGARWSQWLSRVKR